MKLSSTLSWADRLALINRFDLTNQEASVAFGLPEREVIVAKNLQERGVFAPTELNTDIYVPYFGKLRSGEIDNGAQKVYKPKGARPSKITDAFAAISTEPQPVDDIVQKFEVSLAVLRQSKRFDKPDSGAVHIRKDKATGVLMVWRVLP